MQAGLTVLKFSIDGLTDEQSQQVRGKHNNFEKAYQRMLEVIEMKDEKRL